MRRVVICVGLLVWGCGGDPAERHVPVPYPQVDPPPGRLENSSSFLMDDLKIRNMNILSDQLDRAEFEEYVARCLEAGDDTIALFLTNKGDGEPPNTSFYANHEYGGTVDHDMVAEMKARVQYCRDNGLRIHFWIFADDSRFQEYDDAIHVAHISRCVEMFDDLADAWCLGLELDEWFDDKDRIRDLTAKLKDITERPVGVHFTRLKKWSWAIHARADILFGQYGFGKTPEEVREMTEDVIRKLDGRALYWAWEYHRSARTEEAKALGDAAYGVEGCLGTGTGRNADR